MKKFAVGLLIIVVAFLIYKQYQSCSRKELVRMSSSTSHSYEDGQTRMQELGIPQDQEQKLFYVHKPERCLGIKDYSEGFTVNDLRSLSKMVCKKYRLHKDERGKARSFVYRDKDNLAFNRLIITNGRNCFMKIRDGDNKEPYTWGQIVEKEDGPMTKEESMAISMVESHLMSAIATNMILMERYGVMKVGRYTFTLKSERKRMVEVVKKK